MANMEKIGLLKNRTGDWCCLKTFISNSLHEKVDLGLQIYGSYSKKLENKRAIRKNITGIKNFMDKVKPLCP